MSWQTVFSLEQHCMFAVRVLAKKNMRRSKKEQVRSFGSDNEECMKEEILHCKSDDIWCLILIPVTRGVFQLLFGSVYLCGS